MGSNQTSVIRKNHLAKRTSVAPDLQENPPETVAVTQPVVQEVEEVCSTANPNIMILLGELRRCKLSICSNVGKLIILCANKFYFNR